jgi:hypothetical protein
MKTMNSKPIIYWTKELGRLVKNRNKIRHAITKLTRKKLPTDDFVEQYRELRGEFKKESRKAKRNATNKAIEKACEDSTGAAMYKLIKRTEPTLNKKASKREQEGIEARLETKAIAKQFEKIFCQEDALPTEIEKSEMYAEVEILKNLRRIEQVPPFTTRELFRH